MADDASISALVSAHGKWLMALLRGIADNAADAEDAFQETWMRLMRSGVDANDRGIKVYLAKTARSALIDRLRRRQPMESLDAVDETGESVVGEIADSAPGPVERYESKATAADVREAVAALSFNLRQVVLMRIEGEMGFQEIAEELGVPLGTVLSWMSRATQELKKKLGDAR